MSRNFFHCLVYFIICIVNMPVCLAATLFQVGNASALFSGAIEGDMTIQQLKQHGNFGLGTFNDIKGEMIALDGDFYQIGENGKTTLVDLKWKTPYAEIMNFVPKLFIHLDKFENYKLLKEMIYSKLDNKNIPYAVYIKGHFDYIKLRSRSPRSALETKNIIEKIYLLQNISGTLVGYWFPEYLMNLTVPSFHLHFISDDKKRSGHVLDLKIENAQFSLKEIDKIELQFPQTKIYGKANIVAPTLSTYKNAQLYDTK
jgi:acetolactate decarboxylase